MKILWFDPQLNHWLYLNKLEPCCRKHFLVAKNIKLNYPQTSVVTFKTIIFFSKSTLPAGTLLSTRLQLNTTCCVQRCSTPSHKFFKKQLCYQLTCSLHRCVALMSPATDWAPATELSRHPSHLSKQLRSSDHSLVTHVPLHLNILIITLFAGCFVLLDVFCFQGRKTLKKFCS